MAVRGQVIYLAGASSMRDLRDFKYHWTRLVDDLTVDLAASDLNLIGVLQNDPGKGEAAAVAVLGQCKVVAGSAISIGAALGADAEGRAIPGGVAGIALSSCENAGEIISILIK